MNKKELDFILQKGEGLKVEFKESPKNIDKELVAFANTDGGKIFLGVSDNNKVNGINITNGLKSQIQDIANNCDPAIKIELIEFDNILVIDVEEGQDKPYKCSSGFYIRQGPNSQKLSRNEIFNFAVYEGKIKFDSQLIKGFNYPAEFDKIKLKEYLRISGIKDNLSTEEILINLGVAVQKGRKIVFNNAGVLFFSKDPKKFLFTSKVICVNYKTNEKVDVLDRKVFDGGIINNIKDSINYVKKHTDIEFVIKKLKREEIPQYPWEAIREAIVNAIMHRDYFDDSGDILIEIFRNKLIVSNPGGLVKSLKPSEFGKVSRTRNNRISNLLLRTGYVEKLGTGINRIKLAMKKAKLPKPIFKFDSSFFTTFFDKTYARSKVGEKVSEKVGEKVGENQKKILMYIGNDRHITYSALAKKIGITEKSIYKNIEMLKHKGLIKRIGPAKGGYWKIKKIIK